IQAPPRIAIDLPGVGSALGRPTIEVNQGNLRSVSVAQSGDRTRLVLNLKQPSTYRAQLEGKVVLVVLESTGAATASAPKAAVPVHLAAPLNAEQQANKAIGF